MNNMFNIKIVEAPTSEDAKTLALWDSSCFEKDAMELEDWNSVLASPTTVFYASVGEDLAGCAVAKWTTFGIGYLYSNAVLKSYRNMGLGSMLLLNRIAYLQAEKENYIIQAHTRVDNISSGSLLKKHGFLSISYVTDYYDEFEDAILWELKR